MRACLELLMSSPRCGCVKAERSYKLLFLVAVIAVEQSLPTAKKIRYGIAWNCRAYQHHFSAAELTAGQNPGYQPSLIAYGITLASQF